MILNIAMICSIIQPMRSSRRFFEHADRAVMSTHHVNYEINGCLKHKDRDIVVAMGALHLENGPPAVPFTLIIGKKEAS